MKKYFVDTNIILRYLLNDNKKLFIQAKKYFEQAKKKEIELVIIPEVFFEIDYVLRGVYKTSKQEICRIISKILLTPYLKLDQRNTLSDAVKIYAKTNIDLFDIYLFLTARNQNAKVISFDRDFNKLN